MRCTFVMAAPSVVFNRADLHTSSQKLRSVGVKHFNAILLQQKSGVALITSEGGGKVVARSRSAVSLNFHSLDLCQGLRRFFSCVAFFQIGVFCLSHGAGFYHCESAGIQTCQSDWRLCPCSLVIIF